MEEIVDRPTTNILIPTDFTIESLNLFKTAAQLMEGGKANIVFFHAMVLENSIFELLFFSPQKCLEELISKEFMDGCRIISNKYSSKISDFRFELFTGSGRRSFSNFLVGNEIDQVVIPEDYQFKRPHKGSVDPVPFLKNSKGVRVIRSTWKPVSGIPEKDRLAELFQYKNDIPIINHD
jgi:hypothetical protein